jgi:hypothetical protein
VKIKAETVEEDYSTKKFGVCKRAKKAPSAGGVSQEL